MKKFVQQIFRKKNLPVSNSILPTITVRFFSRLQKCEVAITQYIQYGVFSFCLVLFIYNCVVIGYFRWLFLLLLFFFFSYSFVVMDTHNIHPYQHGFSYLCMFSKPQNMIFCCWLYGKMAIRTCKCLKLQIKFHFSLKRF